MGSIVDNIKVKQTFDPDGEKGGYKFEVIPDEPKKEDDKPESDPAVDLSRQYQDLVNVSNPLGYRTGNPLHDGSFKPLDYKALGHAIGMHIGSKL